MKKLFAALALVAMCAACKPAPPPPAPVPTPTPVPVPVGTVDERYHAYLESHYPGCKLVSEQCGESGVVGMLACSATVTSPVGAGTITDRANCPAGLSGACSAR